MNKDRVVQATLVRSPSGTIIVPHLKPEITFTLGERIYLGSLIVSFIIGILAVITGLTVTAINPLINLALLITGGLFVLIPVLLVAGAVTILWTITARSNELVNELRIGELVVLSE
ncbi:MAG: hypothetical protein ACFFD4_39550 [Candidatus Odinarchaeota archaeon]